MHDQGLVQFNRQPDMLAENGLLLLGKLRLIMIILIVIIGKDSVGGRVSLGLASSRIQGFLSKTFGRGK